MRETHSWNRGWVFTPVCTEPFLRGDETDGAQPVELPHGIGDICPNYIDDQSYQTVSGYRRTFVAPEDWRDKSVRLTFDGAAHAAEVFLNGKPVAQHRGGYTAFVVDLSTAGLRYGEENLLSVRLDSRESLNIPPFGGVIDYLTYGGLYREARLTVTERSYIADVFVQTPAAAPEEHPLLVQATLSPVGPSTGLRLRCRVTDGERLLAEHTQPAEPGVQSAGFSVPGAQLWALDSPRLYTLHTQLLCGDSLLDEVETRFGFRYVRFRRDGFYLNGRRVKLRGLNRHQSFAEAGYAMPARPQRLDADICKHELGLNAVRTSHYPQSQHFIERCDELGLLVFTELPGWQHIGDGAWKDTACDMVREMVTQYRNHPSIVLWGVRINESQDDEELYRRTNKIARELDPTRQTGGVRNFPQSQLLEDVYTYNDFSHNGLTPGVALKKDITPDMAKPYLITEFNGHMFPTKSFDNEAKRLEHALRHARVVDGYYGQEDICGGFGWCLFDYHTHRDFGSGDRICYHGVLDLHRNPKTAAAVYRSQSEHEPVLELSSTMDIGEHAAGRLGNVYAFTNADSVRLYKNDRFIQEFWPDRKAFPHMPHPPVPIDDLIGHQLEEQEGLSHDDSETVKALLKAVAEVGPAGLSLAQKRKAAAVLKANDMTYADVGRFYRYVSNWGLEAVSYRFDAVRDGRVVKSLVRETVRQTRLLADCDTDCLTPGDSYDVATVRLRAVDQNDCVLPFCLEPVIVTLTGPLAVMGRSVISLKGGLGGLYLRTTGLSGEATVQLDAGHIGRTECRFTIR